MKSHGSLLPVFRCFHILMVGFPTAKQWHHIDEISQVSPLSEKYKKRKVWKPQQIHELLASFEDDPFLHLTVHFAFVSSLRAGEDSAIGISQINLPENSMWIQQILRCFSGKSLATLRKKKSDLSFLKRFTAGSVMTMISCSAIQTGCRLNQRVSERPAKIRPNTQGLTHKQELSVDLRKCRSVA